ncbi:MAG: hypothetical protein A2836_00160 [Candidatus Taylorbacteria bacterium RIFCSPHIGHO2_01_FULL_45_63]|uniref:Pyrroloquinoline quinone-dependent pyranose dehydrogenase beta-propeller domain-containing protein n=1 Tax=Candidatus Taylorbacteria bacterium RIFCSPHIGHO2_02_FULL_45_35 TaxID=1802311 RepID=A0A1G2MTI1_9BACT|nr:MAG: hypothetical protein A2836_00160 [Candidatus Taylorbacteria bacterium RIFCSPHIGHO2_01_FULL_45_63]OHA27187.1 MAG: hypothetical protein A3D56_01895 [Candidatus Taylorbacteria bacterium RIFCSPHIGHO2_02_FULL_45_35]
MKKTFVWKFIFVLILLVIVGALLWWLKKDIGSIKVPPTRETGTTSGNTNAITDALKVPAGFKIEVYASGLTGARVIEFDSMGRLLVSQTGEGKITALVDTDNDDRVDSLKVILENLNKPHGMAFRCTTSDTNCLLYVAERDALSSYEYDSENITVGQPKKLLDISASLSDRHSTRSLLFLPYPNEDTLLISVGSSCNVCNETDLMRGRIISYNIKTGKSEEYARGLRNSVFMTLDPIFGKVFATEMGRDGLGDDIPPDEINIIEKGKNYGWPFCYGKNVHDGDFDPKGESGVCNTLSPSFIDLQAHSAPLGLAFIPEEGWPEEFWYNLLISFHGSWNRLTPTGYKIVRLRMNSKGEYLGSEDFITGWLKADGKKLGRPVDIKVFSGGTAYISDDLNGLVYKLIRVR